MKKHAWLVAVPIMILLLSRPGAAVNGAREAMAKWYYTVAPSLFPFMALLPLLTSPEAAACAEATLGRLTRALFGLPGSAAPALVIGMLGGSPAGALAARRADGLTRAQLERLCAASCGLSPAFYISGIGASMLGSPALGHVLLRSQILSQLTLLILLRLAPDDGTPAPAQSADPDDTGLPSAVSAILTVGGYMALFGAVAAALGHAAPVLCALDVSSGALLITALNLPVYDRMLLLSALTGFGGACVLMQNISALKQTPLRPPRLIAARVLAAALDPAFTALQLRANTLPLTFPQLHPLHLSALLAIALALPALLRLRKQAT